MTTEETPAAELGTITHAYTPPKGHERVTDGEITVDAYTLKVTAWKHSRDGWRMYARALGMLVKKDGTPSTKASRIVVWRPETIDSAPAWVRAAWMTSLLGHAEPEEVVAIFREADVRKAYQAGRARGAQEAVEYGATLPSVDADVAFRDDLYFWMDENGLGRPGRGGWDRTMGENEAVRESRS